MQGKEDISTRKSSLKRLIAIVAFLLILQPLAGTKLMADGGGGGVPPPGKDDSTHYVNATTQTQSTVETDGEVGGVVSLLMLLELVM